MSVLLEAKQQTSKEKIVEMQIVVFVLSVLMGFHKGFWLCLHYTGSLLRRHEYHT